LAAAVSGAALMFLLMAGESVGAAAGD